MTYISAKTFSIPLPGGQVLTLDKSFEVLACSTHVQSKLLCQTNAQFHILTLKALGFFLPVQHWGGGVFHPLCKIRSRYPRKLKFTGLIAYIMIYKICKFERQ